MRDRASSFRGPPAELLMLLLLTMPATGRNDWLRQGWLARYGAMRARFSRHPPGDIESSGGFATMPCSVGFAPMDSLVLVWVSPTGFWRFSPLALGRCPSDAGDFFGLLFGDLPPLVGGGAIVRGAVRQTEQVWPAPFGIARSAGLCDFEKAKGDGFTDGRRNRMAINSVAAEVIVSDRELAVVAAPVPGEFDFDTIEDAPAG